MSLDEIQPNQPGTIPDDLQTALDEIKAGEDKIDLDMMIKSMKEHAPIYQERSEIARKIPYFWAHTIMNSALITFFDSEDADALSYITDLNIEYSALEQGDPRPVKITFSFGQNPYFNNMTLVKKFTLKPDAPPPSVNFDLTEVGATTPVSIDWKDDEHNIAKKHPQVNSSDDDDFDPGSFFSHFFEGTELDVVGPVATAIIVDVWQNALGIFTKEHENLDFGPEEDILISDDDDDDDDDDDEEDEEDVDPEGENSKKRGRG